MGVCLNYVTQISPLRQLILIIMFLMLNKGNGVESFTQPFVDTIQQHFLASRPLKFHLD